jgi:hypothetical protein
MQSLQIQIEQSKPVVCSPGPSSEKSGISAPAYGIGETPLNALLETRLIPTSRTRRWSPRKNKVQVGNCRWCGAPLWQSTKRPKDCSNTCAKAFSRHVNQLGSLDLPELKKDKDSQLGHSGGLKAIWEQLKAIDRAIRKAVKQEDHARQRALRAAARGLLCRTPTSRREFDRLQYDLELKNQPEDVIKHIHHHEPVTEAKKRIGLITKPPEPTPIAFEQHKTHTQQIIGPARPRRGWRGKNRKAIQVVRDSQWVDQLA